MNGGSIPLIEETIFQQLAQFNLIQSVQAPKIIDCFCVSEMMILTLHEEPNCQTIKCSNIYKHPML